MAALTGWDDDVVFRAGERCAALFGEGMRFSRLYPPGLGLGGGIGLRGERAGVVVEEVLVGAGGVRIRGVDEEEEEDEDDGEEGEEEEEEEEGEEEEEDQEEE